MLQKISAKILQQLAKTSSAKYLFFSNQAYSTALSTGAVLNCGEEVRPSSSFSISLSQKLGYNFFLVITTQIMRLILRLIYVHCHYKQTQLNRHEKKIQELIYHCPLKNLYFPRLEFGCTLAKVFTNNQAHIKREIPITRTRQCVKCS